MKGSDTDCTVLPYLLEWGRAGGGRGGGLGGRAGGGAGVRR